MSRKILEVLICALFFSACGEAECGGNISRPCGSWPCEGLQHCNTETNTWRDCSSLGKSCGICCKCADVDGEVQAQTVWNTGAAELCDDQDNDCDGTTDENCEGCFPPGASRLCGEPGECRGLQICEQDESGKTYWSECYFEKEPTPETCPPDGLDNDCNGLTDDFIEVCNGEDDDCDGQTDEDFECQLGTSRSCRTSCGTYSNKICDSSCHFSDCILPVEVCNGRDDDCDGIADEFPLFVCRMHSTQICTTSCGSTGSQTCDSTCNWGACVPPSETCNGQDDDCDGLLDEDFGCVAGGTGSCVTTCGTTGTQNCDSSCNWGTCTPPAETCNGRDDDCDGFTDEDFACRQGSTGSCTTSCGSTGSRACSSSCSWGTCTPPTESCGNGRDDDCDGSIDEGCCTDVDHDGHFARAGSCPSGDDCNDSNAAVHPGAPEICDGLDNNCDGTTDVIASRTAANVTTTYEVGCTMGDGCCDSPSIGVVQTVTLDPSWFAGMARTRITASVDYAYYASSCPPAPNAEIALVTVVGGTSYRQSRTFGCEVQQPYCYTTTPWGSFSYTWTFSSGTLPSQTYLEVVRDGYYGIKYRNWRVAVEVDCH